MSYAKRRIDGKWAVVQDLTANVSGQEKTYSSELELDEDFHPATDSPPWPHGRHDAQEKK